jgi:dihydrofolate reductase
MTRVTCHLSISLDGFIAGPDQSREDPIGVGGLRLHQWHWRADEPGHEADAGPRDELMRPCGAVLMGRNMFGPIRGAWPDESWRGWWGEEPPFGHDVFVLTHHQRARLAMRNGTTFHFVDATPREVLDMAMRAAEGRDVVLGGGTATIRAFLDAGLVDEMHVAIAPVLLGDGERLFEQRRVDVNGYSCSELTCFAGIAHAQLSRTQPKSDD